MTTNRSKIDKKVAKDIRDIIIFLIGTVGIIHEEFFSDKDRPTLILLYGAMLGVTTWLRLDERKNGGNGGND